jgi:hypothetical protein
VRSRPLDSVSLVAGIGVGLLALLLALDQLASGLAERER